MAARFFARRTRKEALTAVQWEEPSLKREFDGHREAIWDFVFLYDNIHIVSGSVDGTIRKRNCDTELVVGEPWKESGKVEVGPIKTQQGGVCALVYSPLGDQAGTIQFVSGIPGPASLSLAPLKARGSFMCRRCYGTQSNQPLGKPFHQNRDTLCYVSFSRDGSHLAYSGDDGKVDATGGGGFTEEADDDPYNNFFQTSPFHKNAPNVVFSVVAFARTRPWSSQPRNPNQCQKVKWKNAKGEQGQHIDDGCPQFTVPAERKPCQGCYLGIATPFQPGAVFTHGRWLHLDASQTSPFSPRFYLQQSYI
ncbi:uncharacterized protein F5891DRAFT_979593 [Suillus fuscotomentosus]|uniref:Uncharacterized protein n=1 Tax=Suillus fuscotomentosus TaxID=1912939 RepID=A0AAD4E8A2_9AGAM|nr:uncharacterized protein F5891DRAFT_979593 [Suillus fuscotomentosus]KAG1901432.1 hypothetical protein F5891DRAFT_979593 [Suillus fuscotomentosus]